MKKIVALVFAAVCFVGTSFALDFEVGIKGNLGRDLTEGNIVTFVTDTANDPKNFDMESAFAFGGSAYVHASIFPFLGFQIEPTLFTSNVKFNGEGFDQTEKYSALTLDIPVMYWNSIKIWKLGVGVGIGVNFSTDFPLDANYLDYAKDTANALINDPKSFAIGGIAGVDAKLYINKHFGIVASARYVMDFTAKEVPIVVEVIDGVNYDTGKTYPSAEIKRQFVYGSIGVEYKLF